ncbi:MAG TPA: DUF3501 family protein, partial [Alphaproteobacteria bacterium]
MARHKLARADILPMAEFAKVRRDRRRALAEVKRHRRVAVGPHATFYFENRDTIWMQVHEMLFIERGGEAQIAGELEAYNPLIPNGRELVATVMFEIPDVALRRRVLAALGGVEETIELTVAGQAIKGEAEREIDRTTAEGKASAVHFVHFPFTPAQIAAFRDPKA